jgi:hypothetical protein
MMKRRILVTLTAALFLFSIPLAALAMDQGQMKGMNKGAVEHGQMKGMQGGGMMKGMVMLGTRTQDGVKAMAHLKDIHEAMAKMGMRQTHHFMVMFNDAQSGKSVTEGQAAVKIEGPSGEVGKPVMLKGMTMGMMKGFGADITLPEKGKYTFIVGTKLADGQQRQYRFEYTWK